MFGWDPGRIPAFCSCSIGAPAQSLPPRVRTEKERLPESISLYLPSIQFLCGGLPRKYVSDLPVDCWYGHPRQDHSPRRCSDIVASSIGDNRCFSAKTATACPHLWQLQRLLVDRQEDQVFPHYFDRLLHRIQKHLISLLRPDSRNNFRSVVTTKSWILHSAIASLKPRERKFVSIVFRQWGDLQLYQHDEKYERKSFPLVLLLPTKDESPLDAIDFVPTTQAPLERALQK